MGFIDKNMEVLRFQPRGGSIEAWKCKENFCFHGPAGTGKSRTNMEKAHALLIKYGGARGLMLRKTRKSMTETCMFTYAKEVLHPKEGVRFHTTDQKYIYPENPSNGKISEFVVCGLDDPQKILSSQYDFSYWNEMNENRRADYEMVSTRLRNGMIPYNIQFGDTNPDAPTHWIMQLAREGKIRMIKSEHQDNPVLWDAKNNRWTLRGEQYIKKLQDLTGLRYKRYYLGEWCSAEGTVYDEWLPEVHMEPHYTPPADWQHLWIFDFGYKDPFVWQNWVIDNYGIPHLYQEIYHTNKIIQEHCAMIRAVTQNQRPPSAVITDHDAQGRATLEKELQIITLLAYKDINEGINAVKKRLKINFDGINMEGDVDRGRPGIKIMEDTLVHPPDPDLVAKFYPASTREEFDSYIWDKNKREGDEAYKDIPVDKFNHGMDALRYMVAYIDDIAVDPQETELTLALGEMEYNRVTISPY